MSKRQDEGAAVQLDPKGQCPPITLDGELASYYLEFAAAAAELEGKYKAHEDAKQRYQRALAIFSKLAVGHKPEGPI